MVFDDMLSGSSLMSVLVGIVVERNNQQSGRSGFLEY